MRIKTAVAIAVGAAFLLVSAAAFAGTGKLKIVLKDDKGIIVNGKVTVKKSSTVRNCNSAAGTCSVADLAVGTWTVSAKSTSGVLTGGPKTATVKAGQTVTVTLVLTDKSGGSR
jgi:hypothetical protein